MPLDLNKNDIEFQKKFDNKVYKIGTSQSLPNKYDKIGKELDAFKREVAQKFIFRTPDLLDKLIFPSEGEMYASLKRDGIFIGYYYNKEENISFFLNSPTRRVYSGLPVDYELEELIDQYLKE
jgi:hypothetical protein